MNIFVVGRKYQGKTTLGIFLADRIRRDEHAYKVLVFEPKWTFRSVPYTDSLEEFERMLDDDELSEAVMLHAGSGATIDDEVDDVEKVREDFTEFYKAAGIEGFLRNPPARPIVVLIDEAYYLTQDHPHPLLARMMRLATEKKLYIILLVHYPTQISRDLRTHVDRYFFFREFEMADLQMVQRLCGEECSEIVSRLPDHHVLMYDVHDRNFKVWSEPEAWFIDTESDWRKESGEDRYSIPAQANA